MYYITEYEILNKSDQEIKFSLLDSECSDVYFLFFPRANIFLQGNVFQSKKNLEIVDALKRLFIYFLRGLCNYWGQLKKRTISLFKLIFVYLFTLEK